MTRSPHAAASADGSANKVATDSVVVEANPSECDPRARELAQELVQWLGIQAELWDVDARQRIVGTAGVADQICRESSALQDVYRTGKTGFIVDNDVVLVAALPLTFMEQRRWIAVFPALARPLQSDDDHEAISQLLGIETQQLSHWCAAQPMGSPEIFERLGSAYLLHKLDQRQTQELSEQVAAAGQRLSSNFDELSLLHRLTRNDLSLAKCRDSLGRQAIEWIHESLKTAGCGLVWRTNASTQTSNETPASPGISVLSTGSFPMAPSQLEQLLGRPEIASLQSPCLIRHNEMPDWTELSVSNELLIAGVRGSTPNQGFLVIVGSDDQPGFSAREFHLIKSVASILASHYANFELYRQQSDLLANVVRAMTSAIDAKDPYTCGHSERVARIAVRLGKELDCTSDELQTLYLGGLLHDIGKIGIEDSVLRKPGKLTDDEFKHIQQHPMLGCRILEDIRQFKDLLPIVRHHHEQWNGRGYPDGLSQKAIPFLARITAVADAFDAMTSSRVYRNGIQLERVEEIFRKGSGEQWDPAVIRAYFRAREDILTIIHDVRRERVSEAVPAEGT